jgi:hypothetical protein
MDAETRQVEAQTRLLEEQQRALERQSSAAASAAPPPTPAPTEVNQQGRDIPPYLADWLRAVESRRHMYADFDSIVFASDVPMTEYMVRLMSASPFAADIRTTMARTRSRLWLSRKCRFSKRQRRLPKSKSALRKTMLQARVVLREARCRGEHLVCVR